MSISQFHTYVIGADTAVGIYLTRVLSEQQYRYKAVGLDRRERFSIQTNARPFFVFTPPLDQPLDLDDLNFWMEAAVEKDAVVILVSSIALAESLSDQGNALNNPDNSQLTENLHILAEFEQNVRQYEKHIILQVGTLLSLSNEDFATVILQQLRCDITLKLDDKQQFAPTPANHVADILLAVMKQCHCTDQLWGSYQFNGMEPTTAYGFAESLLAEAGQFEDFHSSTLRADNEGLKPTLNIPVANGHGLFHSFGIKAKAWRVGLADLVSQYYHD